MTYLFCFLVIGATARDYEHEARAALALAAATRPQYSGKEVIQSTATLPFVVQQYLSTYQQVGRNCTT